MREKAVIGLSGGVDSAVSAWLLKEAGYEVYGLTLRLFDEKQVEDARNTADQLKIPLQVNDIRECFDEKVIRPFIKAYKNGTTPNPCILCNYWIKWGMMADYADRIGASKFATGHYSGVSKLANGRFTLRKAAGDRKDQTYALYLLSQNYLSRTLMPIGGFPKDEIRKMASEIGLSVASKPDSQDICFIPDHDHGTFIESYCSERSLPGNFVDESGKVLGKHKGIIRYTVGQRKGLGLALGSPAYVREIRPETNEVVVGDDKLQCEVWADRLNFPAFTDEECYPGKVIGCMGKIRYNHPGAPCQVEWLDANHIRAVFDKPQRAVTPGQALVLYQGDLLLGGGTIM